MEARPEAIVGGLPVRVPPAYRGQRNYPGLFWAASNQRTLVYESLLELDRLWLADFDPTVVAIATQPLQVRGRDGAALRSHVPDILLVHDDVAAQRLLDTTAAADPRASVSACGTRVEAAILFGGRVKWSV